jgi:spermidine synthase
LAADRAAAVIDAEARASTRAATGGTGLLVALAIAFFFSGAASLVYQVLWMRMMGWVFGVTVYAASTVWATFMAGLALGSLLAGFVGDRVKRPLVWFGAAELAIGATALATPAALSRLQALYVDFYPHLPDSVGALTATRFGIGFIVMIVPTVLMGSTLPLVVKASAVRAGRLGEHIGVLYGSNAAGAIAGTLAAGLYLIPGFGIRRAFFVAAAMNAAVGLTALLLAALDRRPEAPAPIDKTGGPRPITTPAIAGVALDRRRLRIVLGVFALSGLTSLGLEVVWFRVLTLFIRPTVYSFSAMLATVLAGIALGSYLVTPLLTRRLKWITVLALLQLATGIVVVLSFWPLVYLPAFTEQLTPMVARVLPEFMAFPLAGSLLAIFPAALLMGLAFPIGLHLWTSGVSGLGERTAGRIGLFYALNVTGAIAGSLIAGFFLLPLLGSQASLTLLAGVGFASGLVLLAASELPAPARAAVGALTVTGFAAAVWFAPDPFALFVAERFPAHQVIWREEGVEATVVVHEAGRRMMTINGNHQAGTDGPTAITHHRIGHLPMALHPTARTALVVGLGGGATPGAVSVHEGIQVDVVELAGAVVRGAAFFEEINYNVLTRPNVHLRVDDGRNFMMLTPNRYDIVTADAIVPMFAGAGNLYSAEYFRLMRRVLGPGGLVVQWVWGTEAEYKAIARTFLSVFPNTTVWLDGSLLVGSLEPLKIRRQDFDWKLGLPGRAQGLRDMDVASYEDLRRAFKAGPDELRAFVGDGPILTDDRPLAEYFLSLPRDRSPDLDALKGDVNWFME